MKKKEVRFILGMTVLLLFSLVLLGLSAVISPSSVKTIVAISGFTLAVLSVGTVIYRALTAD